MSPVEWLLIIVAVVCFGGLLFFPGSRRHWPIVVFIGLVALLGLLLVNMGVDLDECRRVGLDCL
jgi:uncharacterized membrane protein